MGKKLNASRNAVFGIVQTLIVTLIPFFMRMALIEVLGSKYLGLNNLFHSILSMLCMADIGFGGVIVYEMYKPVAKGDINKVNALLNFYKKVCIVLGLIILVVGLAFIPFLDKSISGSYPSDVNIKLVYLVYLLEIFFSYTFFSYYNVIFSTHQRNDYVSRTNSLVNIIIYAIRIFVLYTFKNYYLFIIFLPVTRIIEGITIYLLAKKKFPQYKCIGSINKVEKKELLNKTVALGFNSIGGRISSSIGTIFISSNLGLTEVAIYSNYLYIVNSLQGIISTIISSSGSAFGINAITKSKENAYSNFKIINYINMWLITWTGACMFVLYQHFMNLWMGKDLLASDYFVVLIYIYHYFTCVRIPVNTLKGALGLWEKDKYKTLIGAFIIVITNILLIKKIGMFASLLSIVLSIAIVLRPIETNILFKDYFKQKQINYYLNQIKYILIMLLSLFISYYVCKYIANTQILGFFIKGIITFLICNIIYLLFTYKTNEFKILFDIFKKKYLEIKHKKA